MSTIKRINYRNTFKENSAFEIVDLQLFMSTRPHHHLNRDYRITFWTMMYIIKGEGIHYVDFEPYPYKAGDIIVIQNNQVNRFVVNKEVQGYIVIINEPFFFKEQGSNNEKILEFFERPYKNPIFSVDNGEISTNRILIELIYKEYMKTNQAFNEDLIGALFHSFVYALNEFSEETIKSKGTATFRTYNHFRQLVEANYTKIKSVDAYSNIMLVSKKTINSATRSIVGLSAKQFIINRIILEIKRYLSQGDLMNYEIADLLGFDEPSNLTKFFRRYEGMSPTAFKESLKLS